MNITTIVFTFMTTYYVPIIVAYIAGGAVYALLKWVIQLRKLRREVLAIKIENRTTNSYPGSTDEQWIQIQRCKAASMIFNNSTYPPTASSNKGNLMTWAIFWPINLIWTMFADVAKEAWNFLYRKFGAMFDSISKSILPK